MKQILYLSQYYPPEIGAGAVRSDFMSRYLSEDGWKVDVVCERPNYPTGEMNKHFKTRWTYVEKESDNLKIHRIWSVANKRKNVMQQLLFFISFMISSFFYVLSNPKRYDIIYASSPPIFVGISGCLLSKLLGTKFVFEVRDIWPDAAVDQIDLENESLFIRIGKKIERWLYKNADLIVPVTTAADTVIRNRSKGTPASVIPNGVDLELFKKMVNPTENMDEVYDQSKFRVGYVGSLGVIHDLRTFVAAAKFCEDDPNIQFVIVGDGGRNNQLKDFIMEFEPVNLEWVGLKKYEQIPYYISSLDIAVNPINPSKAFESIVTVKFYEYLACEVPVITCGRGLMKHIGDESGAAITIEPKNPVQLAEKIKSLKEDGTTRKKLAASGRNFVKVNYSRKKLAEKLSETLRQVTLSV